MKSIRIIINSINNYRRADCELCCVIIYEGMSHWFFNTFRDIYLSEIRWLKYITGAFPLVMPNTHTNNDGEWEMKEQRCKEKTVGVDLFRVIPTKILSISVATLFEVISLGWALMTAAMSAPCVCVCERETKRKRCRAGDVYIISLSLWLMIHFSS